MSRIPKAVRTKLLAYILDKYPTIKAFAKDLGVHRNTVRNVLMGGNTTNEIWIKMAELLGINIDQLFECIKEK